MEIGFSFDVGRIGDVLPRIQFTEKLTPNVNTHCLLLAGVRHDFGFLFDAVPALSARRVEICCDTWHRLLRANIVCDELRFARSHHPKI
jgi:hypothetical protein